MIIKLNISNIIQSMILFLKSFYIMIRKECKLQDLCSSNNNWTKALPTEMHQVSIMNV